MCKKYFFILIVFCIFFSAVASDAVELKKYEYQMDNRHDPFFPFIQQKGIIESAVAVRQPNRGGIPLEPSQLKLAAIVRAQDSWKAMAEDVTGKGYILQEGTPVGSYATVANIDAGQVLFEETHTNQFDKIVVKRTVLRLQQEGGQ